MSGWQLPLATLAAWLDQRKRTLADVEVIVSDSLVRYALIPWSDDVQKGAELDAFSRIHFESLFGSSVADWKIQIDAGDYGKQRIACAMDNGMIEALHALFAKHGLRFVLLQPYFMHVFNRWRQRFLGNALCVMLDSGWVMFASFKEGNWHNIRTIRVGDDVSSSLPDLIEREMLLQGLDAKAAVYLHNLLPIDVAALKRRREVTVLEAHKPTSHSAIKLAAGQSMLHCRGM
jgi:hypothetical protein